MKQHNNCNVAVVDIICEDYQSNVLDFSVSILTEQSQTADNTEENKWVLESRQKPGQEVAGVNCVTVLGL